MQQLGPYQLNGVLGRGGFGVVYSAQDKDGEVAVKVMHEALARDEKMRKWFHREARAMATLQHDGIVKVLAYSGQDVPLPYLAMERLRGHTLGEVLEKLGPLPATAVVDVAIQIGDALAYAHGRGIIHRDLKPTNFFVEPDGRVVLTDFGLARALANVNLGASLQTSGKEIVGTALYLAPEVMDDGGAVSAASDVYALGVSLYQLATGTLPFPTGNPMQMITAIMTGKHAPLARPGYSPALSALIDRTFSVNKNERPQDVVAAYACVMPVRASREALQDLLRDRSDLTSFTSST